MSSLPRAYLGLVTFLNNARRTDLISTALIRNVLRHRHACWQVEEDTSGSWTIDAEGLKSRVSCGNAAPTCSTSRTFPNGRCSRRSARRAPDRHTWTASEGCSDAAWTLSAGPPLAECSRSLNVKGSLWQQFWHIEYFALVASFSHRGPARRDKSDRSAARVVLIDPSIGILASWPGRSGVHEFPIPEVNRARARTT